MLKINVLCFIALSILLNACSDHYQDNNPGTLDLDEVPGFKLKEEFNISEFNEDLFFGYVSNVVSGLDSTIFVSDPTTQKIYLFSNRGTYNGFLGGYGAGPGEFRRISNMYLLAPDTLQVVDITSGRLTNYTLYQKEWVLSGTMDYPISPDIGSDHDMFAFRQFYRIENGYIGLFESTISTFESDTGNFISVCFILYYENLHVNNNYAPVCYNRIGLVVHQYSDASVQTVSTITVPEGYQTFYAVSPHGDIVTTWTENPIISIQSTEREAVREFMYHSAKVPITPDMKLDLVKKALPNEERSNIRRSQIMEEIPEYKGFSRQLLIDDKDQIWVLANSQDHNLEWLIYDFNGNLKGKVLHPGGNFMQVKNNRIYIAQHSGDVEPSFSVYSIQY